MLRMKNIDSDNTKYTEILTANTKISGQHVKLLPVRTSQGRSRYLIYSKITILVSIQIFFMLRMKNIDSNDPKYTEILIQNTKISGQHIKLLPVPTTQRRNRYLIYSEIITFVPTWIFFILRIKNIDSNNHKYTEILTKNKLISVQHVKLLPLARTQR